nr:hypothetical protein [Trichocoleus desertorum]
MQWRAIAYQAAAIGSVLATWGLHHASAQAALLVGIALRMQARTL